MRLYQHGIVLILSIATASVNCYKATIVEHIPESVEDAKVTIERNLKSYDKYIQNAKKAGSQIIVFPEYGLTHLLSKNVLKQSAIQIKTNLNSEMEEGHLKTLSNAAKENGIYVVVNFIEIEYASKDEIFYNTNVVFDRDGNIIAKYRKINLYNEEGLTPGKVGNVTFTTDFGVKFGIFTCFDILFYNPSRLVLEDEHVTDIIYPAAWSSLLPVYISTAIQHGYVKSTGVNLLAANLNIPKKGISGSGIYDGTGKIKTIEINGASKSIDKTEVVIEHKKRVDSCHINKENDEDFNVFALRPDENDPNELKFLDIEMHSQANKYKYTNLDLSSGDIHKEVCSGSFCCTFNIKVNNYVKDEYYRLATYRDTIHNKDVSFCLLVHCGNEAIESCGSRSKTNTTFSRIEVYAHFKPYSYAFYQPYSIQYNYKPIEEIYYCNEELKANTSSLVKLVTNSTDNLIAIGLLAAGSGTMVAFNSFLILVVLYNIFINLQ